MKYLLTITLLSMLLFSNDEFNIEDDFLQSLNEVSEIATKSKLNIDDSPSFVTVLQSKKLQNLGVDTVYDALAQVPGVQLKREASGVPVVVFRGVSQKGEVKLMLDGVTINNTYRGSIYHYLDFPIEMVERIEIIRGAGSVLYGSGAMSGVINIITKSADAENKNAVFISGGTYDTYKSGAIFSQTLGTLRLSIDAYYQTNNKNIDNTDRHSDDYSIGLKIKDEHLSIISRLKDSTVGNAYGVLLAPDSDIDKYYNENSSLFFELSYENKLTKNNSYKILAGYSQYLQTIEANIAVASIDSIDLDYKENSYYAQLDFTSKTFSDNELLIGSRLETAKTITSDISLGDPISDPNFSRDIISVYINDIYTFSPSLDISAGLRFDDYSDFGDAFCPTLGAIYKIGKHFRIKALYSEAYRAPSWVELTSNPLLNAETSRSYEAGIIYNNNQNSVVRLNLYSTKIDDLITKDTQYIQTQYADFKGSEIEYIYTPNNQLELNLFASYVQANDADGEALADIANTLATASLAYEFNFGLKIGTLLKYVSSSERSDVDTRDSMPSSTILDETFSYRFKDIRASLIIKDIFDQGTYYALPTTTENNDFDDGGRSILVKASWEF